MLRLQYLKKQVKHLVLGQVDELCQYVVQDADEMTRYFQLEQLGSCLRAVKLLKVESELYDLIKLLVKPEMDKLERAAVFERANQLPYFDNFFSGLHFLIKKYMPILQMTMDERDEHFTAGFEIFSIVIWNPVFEAITTESLSFFTSTSFKSLQEAKVFASNMRVFCRDYAPFISKFLKCEAAELTDRIFDIKTYLSMFQLQLIDHCLLKWQQAWDKTGHPESLTNETFQFVDQIILGKDYEINSDI